jgi:N-acyl amino acid synthase of PEP-CTERM/exosortase system
MSAKIQLAQSAQAKADTFNIRHRVYCEEQGWEAPRLDRSEADSYDVFSSHVVLRDDENGSSLGTVRIVPAQMRGVDIILPLERCYGTSLSKVFPGQVFPNRAKIAEVSRLAVLPEFRGLVDHPLSQETGTTPRATRYHAVRLFLGALAAAERNHIEVLVMLIEPKLRRYLSALGFQHSFIGDAVDHRGIRVPIVANVNAVIHNLPSTLSNEFKAIIDDA